MKTLISFVVIILAAVSAPAQDLVLRAFNDSIAPAINALRPVSDHSYYSIETQFGTDSAVLYRATREVDMLTRVRMLDPLTPIRPRLYSADGEWCIAFAHAPGSNVATALDICNLPWNSHQQLSLTKLGAQFSIDATRAEDVYRFSDDGSCAMIRLIETLNGVQYHALAVINLKQSRIVAIVSDRSMKLVSTMNLMDVTIDIDLAQAFFTYRSKGTSSVQCVIQVVNMETNSSRQVHFSCPDATVFMKTSAIRGTGSVRTVAVGTHDYVCSTIDTRTMSISTSSTTSLDSLCGSPRGRRLLLSESQRRLIVFDSLLTGEVAAKNMFIVDLYARSLSLQQHCSMIPTALCFDNEETSVVFCHEMDIMRLHHDTREGFFAKLPYIWQSNESTSMKMTIAFRPDVSKHQLYITDQVGAVSRFNLDLDNVYLREVVRKGDPQGTGAQMSFSTDGSFLSVNSAASCLTKKLPDMPSGLICRFYGDGQHYVTMSPGRINYCTIPYNQNHISVDDLPIVAMDLSTINDTIAVAESGGNISLCTHQNLKKRFPFVHLQTEVRSLQFSLDGTVLLAIGANNKAYVYDVHERVLQTQLDLRANTTTCFSPDSKALYYIDSDTSIALWSLAHKRLASRLIVPRGRLQSLSMTTDQRMLACATRDGFILIWKLDSTIDAKQLVLPVHDDLELNPSPVLGNDLYIRSPMVYSATSLSMYNEQGSEVHHEELNPAGQAIYVNLSSFTSGFYLLVLRGPDFTQTQRLMVVH